LWASTSLAVSRCTYPALLSRLLVCKKLPGSSVAFWLYESLPPALCALLGASAAQRLPGQIAGIRRVAGSGHLLLGGPVKRDPLNKGQITS
jgi:hypothetical protein